jgi:hypothetical protein
MMKRILCLAAVMGMAMVARAGEAEHAMPAHEGSAELQKMKSLAGTWQGKSDHGEGLMDMVVTYAVTAAGSAVVETLNPGAPHEMVSVYHDADGKMVMTHYCMLGNQPYLQVTGSTAKSITMDLSATSNIDVAKEEHMHGVSIVFIDDRTISQRWSHYKDGDRAAEVQIELKRVK